MNTTTNKNEAANSERFSPDQFEEFRRILLLERQTLVSREKELTREHLAELTNEETTEHARGRRFSGDLGAVVQDQETALERAQDMWAKVKMVDEALERIDRGTYGKCRECESAIEEARLRLVPTAAYCRECQKNVELEAARIREGAHTHLNQITQ